MQNKIALGIVLGTFALVALIANLAVGGPLEPPTGAITPTDATLLNDQGQSYPIVITEPGLYRLTSDLTPGTGRAILVAANDVTLDLNGFTIRGNGSGDGVRVVFPESGTFTEYANTRIMNGTIASFSLGVTSSVSDGLGAFSLLVDSSFSDLTIRDCSVGIQCGSGSVVHGCRFHSNGSGLLAGRGTTVSGCQFKDNDTHASVAERVVIKDNAFYDGQVGIRAQTASPTAHITIIENTFLGVAAGAVDIEFAQRNFIYNNIAADCGPTAFSAPNSDDPVSINSGGVGVRDNIAPLSGP